MKFPKVFRDLGHFWILLDSLGINLNVNLKKVHFLFYIFLSISLFIVLLNLIYFYIHSQQLATFINLMIMALLSILGYFSLYRKRLNLKLLRKFMKISVFDIRMKTSTNIMISIFSIVAFFIFFANLFFYFCFGDKRLEMYEVFRFQNRLLTNLLTFAVMNLHCFIQFTLPNLLICSFSAICYYWKEIINGLTDEIKKRGKQLFNDSSNFQAAVCTLERCKTVWYVSELMRDTFESFLLYMCVQQICSIFIEATHTIRKMDYSDLGVHLNLVLQFFFFTITVFIASSISEAMENLLKQLNAVYDDLIFESKYISSTSVKKRMMLIMRKKPVSLSIGGCTNMSKSFILVTLGTLITYGTIIVPMY